MSDPMTPDLPTRVREAFETAEVVEAVARSIAEQGIRALNGKEATWEQHGDGFRFMARDALAAIPDAALVAVIAVVQEDRTREIVEHCDCRVTCGDTDNEEGVCKWPEQWPTNRRAANAILANKLRRAMFDASIAKTERDLAVQRATLTLAQALRVIRDTTGGYAANVARRALDEANVADPVDGSEAF